MDQKNESRQRIFRTFAKFAENKAKMYCLVLKIEDNVQISEKTKKSGIAYDVTPAGCGLDFEGISSPQSPAITARNYWTCNGVVGGQYR